MLYSFINPLTKNKYVILILSFLLVFMSFALLYPTKTSATTTESTSSQRKTTTSSSSSTTQDYTTKKTTSNYDYDSTTSYYYDYDEIDENNSLHSSSDNYYYDEDYNYYDSSSTTKKSSSTDSLLPKSNNKTPSEINSQDWEQLLANLNSDSNNKNNFTFSDNPSDSNSTDNSSSILWLGVVFIILAVLGLYWVIYTEFISKKSPRKMRAAAIARLNAKKKNEQILKQNSNNKNYKSNINSYISNNEYGDPYISSSIKRKPPQPPSLDTSKRNVSISGSAGKPKSNPSAKYNKKPSNTSSSSTYKKNTTSNNTKYNKYPQNYKSNTNRPYPNRNKTFWDKFFGK